MFDFSASGQALEARRRPVLPIATSVAIHATAVTLVLALTFSGGLVERPRPLRAMILLSPPPVFHAARQVASRMDRTPPRLFRAPVIRREVTPLRETAPVPVLQIPLLEVVRPLLPTVEVARLSVAAPPPLRTDNLAPATKFAGNRAAASCPIERV